MTSLRECYEILGIKPDASSQEVRSAYLKLVKQWHPDRQSRTSSFNSQAQDRFLQIQKAYEQIKQHQSSKTDRSQGSVPSAPKSQSAPKSSKTTTSKQQQSSQVNAEVLYANAAELGGQGLYRDAIAELSRAIRINPNYVLAYKYRGHLRSLLGLERQAEADLNKAHVLERMGSFATAKSPADIEAMARNYSYSRWRSPFRKNIRYRGKQSFPKRLMRWCFVIVVGGLGLSLLLRLFPLNGSRELDPLPLQFDAPVES